VSTNACAVLIMRTCETGLCREHGLNSPQRFCLVYPRSMNMQQLIGSTGDILSCPCQSLLYLLSEANSRQSKYA
jgi:hypothetical protein